MLRPPPGRAGRAWLTRRLELARSGADVLEQKRRALLDERRRLEPLVAEAQADWEREAAAAERWLTRATVLAGARRIELARRYRGASASVTPGWRSVLGVVCPEVPELVLPQPSDAQRIGGSAALAVAADAHRRALRAAARSAALRMALERISDELERTTRRLRAIEHRWIPRHELALSALHLALDENERVEAARVRWAAARSRR